MMCVVRLCNIALNRYSKIDGKEPETVGSMEWNAWYIVGGKVRVLGILRKTAASEAHKLKVHHQRLFVEEEHCLKLLGWKGKRPAATGAAMTVQAEGACPMNYSLPLLDNGLFVAKYNNLNDNDICILTNIVRSIKRSVDSVMMTEQIHTIQLLPALP